MIRSFDLACAGVALWLVLAPFDGRADEVTTDPKVMARDRGVEALKLHADGKFVEAYEKFETAERLAHSPVFLLWMARTKRAVGQLFASRTLYQRVVSETLSADVSANWAQAQVEAQTELAELSARIPKLQVRIRGGLGGGTVFLDKAPIGLDQPVEVDAGAHVVRVARAGQPELTRSLTFEEGQPLQLIEFELTAEQPPTIDEQGSAVPGAVLLGAGLSGVIAGAVTGGYALSLAGDIHDGCIGNRCRAEDAERADLADTLARASTGLFIAGGVVSAVGVVFVIVRPGGGEPTRNTLLRLTPTSMQFQQHF